MEWKKPKSHTFPKNKMIVTVVFVSLPIDKAQLQYLGEVSFFVQQCQQTNRFTQEKVQ